MPCDWVARVVNAGDSVQCPNNDCGPIPIRDSQGNPTGGFESFRAFGDGNQGWLSVTAVYVRNGGWYDPVTGKEGNFRFAGQSGRGKVTYLEPNNPVNPLIESILDGFTKLPKCLEAYEALGIDLKKLLDRGIVVGGSHLLTDLWHDAKSLGLTQYAYNESKQNIDSGVDAFTVPPEYRNFKTGNEPLVTDGRPHIFLNAGATTNGYNRLKEDFAHELIHAGGYAGRKPGFFRVLAGKNDLYYLGDKLNAVEKECGYAPTPP